MPELTLETLKALPPEVRAGRLKFLLAVASAPVGISRPPGVKREIQRIIELEYPKDDPADSAWTHA